MPDSPPPDRFPGPTLQKRLMAGVSSGNEAWVRTTLAAGAQVNVLGSDPFPSAHEHRGWTPLGLAVAHNHLDTVQILLDAGADPNQPDAWGQAPLHLMETNRGTFPFTQDLLNRLLAGGADPNRRVQPSSARPAGKGAPDGDTSLLTLLGNRFEKPTEICPFLDKSERRSRVNGDRERFGRGISPRSNGGPVFR